ncbi:MAG: DUF6183 family protein [Ilumatobacteraceae bacterium]
MTGLGEGDEIDEIDELVHRADLDGLIRLIDAFGASRQWDRVLAVRDRSRAALRTGRQLWPAATLAEYRLALWAPPEWAARVLDEESGRFTIGPLTEVAAQHHDLASLREHLPDSPRLGFIAHERALRGEQVPDDVPNPLDLPFALQPWEPSYTLATYSDAGLEAPTPPLVAGDRFVPIEPSNAPEVDDDAVQLAVRQLFEPWTAASNGRVEVCCVEGTAAQAVTAHGVRHASLARLTPSEALAWLAWAGASGGAHGRRRGGAIGRFGAWWLLAALGDMIDDWPIDPAELGSLASSLEWSWWSAHEPHLGWEVRLAIEDPAEGYAWSITALDTA